MKPLLILASSFLALICVFGSCSSSNQTTKPKAAEQSGQEQNEATPERTQLQRPRQPQMPWQQTQSSGQPQQQPQQYLDGRKVFSPQQLAKKKAPENYEACDCPCGGHYNNGLYYCDPYYKNPYDNCSVNSKAPPLTSKAAKQVKEAKQPSPAKTPSKPSAKPQRPCSSYCPPCECVWEYECEYECECEPGRECQCGKRTLLSK